MMQICYLRPYIGTETACCVTKDAGKDENGLKFEKVGPFFFSSFHDMPEIFQKVIIMITVVSVP